MRRKTALAFGIGASLILAAGTASADCATEVQALQDQLNIAADSPNARTGPGETGVQQPDPGASVDMSENTTTTSPTINEDVPPHRGANATIGPTDPGVQQPDPGAPTDMSAADDTVTGTSPYPSDGSGNNWPQEREGTNATIGPTDPGAQQPQNEDMDVTQRSPDYSTTMPSGTVGTGTITETTRSGELAEPADSRSIAITSLKRAQLYSDAGQEEACMVELSTAKQHLGVE
jgi:hypothetical protein